MWGGGGQTKFVHEGVGDYVNHENYRIGDVSNLLFEPDREAYFLIIAFFPSTARSNSVQYPDLHIMLPAFWIRDLHLVVSI